MEAGTRLLGLRLRYRSWLCARDYGFAHLGFKQIVSFTVPANQRSRNVMERIGITRSLDDDFEHPLLAQGHPLRHHVLYRLARPAQFDA